MSHLNYTKRSKQINGFTIVELLIVIVVIGIIAAISMVSYGSVANRAIESALMADLSNASRSLTSHRVIYQNFPDTIDCNVAESSTNLCLNLSPNTNLDYRLTALPTKNIFCLELNQRDVRYHLNHDNEILAGPCPMLHLNTKSNLSYPGSGTTWFDISGNDYVSTVYGNIATVNSATGSVFQFDDLDDYVNTANLPTTNTFSISIWFKTTTHVDGDRLYWGSGSNRAILANTSNPGQLQWYFQTSVANTGYRWTVGRYTVGEWNLATLVYDGQLGRFYINGERDQTTHAITGTSSASAFNIGTNYAHSGLWYNGQVADFKFYDSALSDTEARRLFEGEKGSYGL